MAYIVLHHVDPEKKRARYYALTWQPALTGGWAVERQWGPLDSQRRQVTVNLVEDGEQARTLVIRHLRRRLQHGYHLVTLEQAEAVLQAVADLLGDQSRLPARGSPAKAFRDTKLTPGDGTLASGG